MTDRSEFYTKIKRSMFSRINEVGAKPFLLFQYYLTYSTAPKINPSLKTIARDMGILDKKGNPQISAVCHLKKQLIAAGWIKEENGEILITIHIEKISIVEKISTEELRKSQLPIEKISTPIEKISTNSLENLNSPYIRTENEQEKEQLERTVEEKENNSEAELQKKNPTRQKNKTLIPFNFSINENMRLWAKEKVPELDIDYETENFVDHYANKGENGLDWTAKWRTWMRNSYTDFGKYPNGKTREFISNNGVKTNGTNQPNGYGHSRKKTNAEILAESADFYANYDKYAS